MEYLYKIKEVDKGYALFGKTGNQLISFLIEEPHCFHVIYNNTNIDKEDLLINAEFQCGATYDWKVYCESEDECLRCCLRFMELASNGFVSDLREMIAMDWGDLERVCIERETGHYYYAEGDLKSIYDFTNSLSNKILTDYGENAQCIICVDGDVDLSEFHNITHMWDYEKNVVQFLFDEKAEKIQLDIWVNP